MNSETNPTQVPATTAQVAQTTLGQGAQQTESALTETTSEAALSGTSQWEDVQNEIAVFLDKLPEYVGNFFKEFRRPIIAIVLILAAVVLVKLAIALIKAINEIPVLPPLFEFIGFAYTFWFVYRYLIYADQRQELLSNLQSYWQQIVGQG